MVCTFQGCTLFGITRTKYKRKICLRCKQIGVEAPFYENDWSINRYKQIKKTFSIIRIACMFYGARGIKGGRAGFYLYLTLQICVFLCIVRCQFEFAISSIIQNRSGVFVFLCISLHLNCECEWVQICGVFICFYHIECRHIQITYPNPYRTHSRPPQSKKREREKKM